MNGVVRTDLSAGSFSLDREQRAEQKANSLNLWNWFRCNEKLNRKCKPSHSEQDEILENAEKQWFSTKTEKLADAERMSKLKLILQWELIYSALYLQCMWAWDGGICQHDVERSEINLTESALSFYFYVDPRPEQQAPLATEPSHQL